MIHGGSAELVQRLVDFRADVNDQSFTWWGRDRSGAALRPKSDPTEVWEADLVHQDDLPRWAWWNPADAGHAHLAVRRCCCAGGFGRAGGATERPGVEGGGLC